METEIKLQKLNFVVSFRKNKRGPGGRAVTEEKLQISRILKINLRKRHVLNTARWQDNSAVLIHDASLSFQEADVCDGFTLSAPLKCAHMY